MRFVFFGTAALCLLASAAHADVLWRGDFSTGDLSQWDNPESASPNDTNWDPSRLSVVTSMHPPDAAQSLQVVLDAGDITYDYNHSPAINMGSRSEVTHAPLLGEGDDRWYRWEVYFPSSYQVNDGAGGGAVFTQWHHTSPTQGEPGSPPLLFSALTNELELVNVPTLNSQSANVVWTTPMVNDQWHTFVVHIHFSSDPSQGVVEIYYDNAQPFSTNVNTLFPGFTDYLKAGQYRRPNATPSDTTYIANFVEATSQSDVMTGSTAEASSPSSSSAPQTGSSSAASTASDGTAASGKGCQSTGKAGMVSLALLSGLLVYRRSKRRLDNARLTA